mmetsp:Transcript_32656/g.44189  ORF Transcript_32656/g.44189 Transcript_32656/m.44189 type:complete len:109 (+) Transcript_32656:551-877(+)
MHSAAMGTAAVVQEEGALHHRVGEHSAAWCTAVQEEGALHHRIGQQQQAEMSQTPDLSPAALLLLCSLVIWRWVLIGCYDWCTQFFFPKRTHRPPLSQEKRRSWSLWC